MIGYGFTRAIKLKGWRYDIHDFTPTVPTPWHDNFVHVCALHRAPRGHAPASAPSGRDQSGEHTCQCIKEGRIWLMHPARSSPRQAPHEQKGAAGRAGDADTRSAGPPTPAVGCRGRRPRRAVAALRRCRSHRRVAQVDLAGGAPVAPPRASAAPQPQCPTLRGVPGWEGDAAATAKLRRRAGGPSRASSRPKSDLRRHAWSGAPSRGGVGRREASRTWAFPSRTCAEPSPT